MGNLLGSPITEKYTHTGKTHDTNKDTKQSPDGGGLQYGISSMQGWRVHMEDAHICQPFLYAEKLLVDDNDGSSGADEKNASNADNSSNNETPSKKTAIEATLSTQQDDSKTEVNVTEKTPTKSSSTTSTSNKTYKQIPIPNHSLFAVFDGHGGSFAAEYASRNMLRVLCRTPSFVEYAEKWQGRNDYLVGLRDKLSLDTKQTTATTKETPPKEVLNDKQRLQMLKKRGLESDEKVKQIKEQVRKHFDGEKLDVTNITTNNTTAAATTTEDSKMDDNNDPMENNTEYQYAQATYDHELMTLLEHALRDAFINIDKEILREVQGDRVQESNFVYGKDYDISRHGLDGCVGHLPKEASSGSSVPGLGADAANTDTNDTAQSGSEEKEECHPTPNDDEDAGTTAVVVMTTPRWIVCANAGDSRAVYSRSNHRAVPLSYDHKPDDEDEERRIREAGGYVSGGRVEGDLAVSRGLGDYRFKDLDAVMSGSKGESVRRDTSILQRQIANTLQVNEGGDKDVPMLRPSEQKVSPLPDIIVQNRDPKEDEFIIIACDGIWDVQTNQECVRMVADIFAEGESDMGLACEEILDLCLIKGSKDNMTAGIIKFPKQTTGSGGGVMARRERRGAIDAENDDRHEQALRRVYNPYLPPGARENEGADGGENTESNSTEE